MVTVSHTSLNSERKESSNPRRVRRSEKAHISLEIEDASLPSSFYFIDAYSVLRFDVLISNLKKN